MIENVPKSPGELIDYRMIMSNGLVVHTPCSANDFQSAFID